MTTATGNEIIDVEEFARSGKKIPEGKAYRIRVDTKTFVVEVSHMKARAILELAGKSPPEKYKIYQKFKGEPQPKLLGLDDDVSFVEPGVERFTTIPLDQTDGLAPPPRRHFQMPESDRLFLEERYPNHETVREGDSKLLILPVYNVPAGYAPSAVALALRIDPKYPTSQIDMVYFSPELSRKDGRALFSVSTAGFDGGRKWQQWSRHRTAANPWREGFDGVETHLMLVEHWLTAELKR